MIVVFAFVVPSATTVRIKNFDSTTSASGRKVRITIILEEKKSRFPRRCHQPSLATVYFLFVVRADARISITTGDRSKG